MVEKGEDAPDFTLEGAQGEEIREFSLSEYATPVVLVFYIYDYSPVCTTQMCEVNDMEFLTFTEDVTVLGISTDGPYSHRQFIKDNNLTYPLLSDGDKDVYEKYGMLDRTDESKRQPKRGIVLVDSDRTVEYTWRAPGNWDAWRTEPLREVNEVLRDITA